jgi:hypothetical protein
MKGMAVAIVLLLGAVVSAQADTWTFKDISSPRGSERDMTAKRADARTCGSSDGQSFDTADASRFRKCMRAHGWALDHVEREAAQASDGTAADVKFADMKPGGRSRGDGDLQVDTHRCEVTAPDYESAGFKQCMRGLGWRYRYTLRFPSHETSAEWRKYHPAVDWTDFLPCCGQYRPGPMTSGELSPPQPPTGPLSSTPLPSGSVR